MKTNVLLGISAFVLGCLAFSAYAQFGTEPDFHIMMSLDGLINEMR